MGEVEAQLVRAYVGAGLAHVAADPLAQCRLQQVRGGVVALGRVPGPMIDPREHLLADVERARLDDHRWNPVLAEHQHVLDARAAVAVLAFDRADV